MNEKTTIEKLIQATGKEPYARKMGIRTVSLEAGHAVVEMDSSEDDGNIFGMIHGGAIFSLIDEAFQLSCNSHGTVAVALNVTVTYHRPPGKGGILRAESREIHRSRRTGTYDIKVTDSKDKLIASCMALAYRKGDPLPFLDEVEGY
ncbi:MAG: hotdog fold thioesterase [Deltaproteobacteria bacterium]|nr:hotdog fold thioesterase [Deltaproteobacteria bacterium]